MTTRDDPDPFEHLLHLLHLEEEAVRSRAREEAEGLSLQEREARGHALLDLEATDESLGLGGRVLITFEKPRRAPLPTRLDPGDLVVLSPRKAEVEEPARGTVARAGRRSVTVAFDRPPPDYVHEGRLKAEVVPNDVTFRRAAAAVRGVKALEGARGRRLRALLYGEGSPTPAGSAAEAWSPSRPLNPEQHEAVVGALNAEELFLIHGPPGTGKSTVLAEVAVQAVRSGRRLLACAASNAAVDHLLELFVDAGLEAVRIGHPARVAEALVPYTLDVLVEAHPDRKLSKALFDEAHAAFGYARRQRSQGRSRERFANARSSVRDAKQCIADARALEKKAVDAVLGRARVVCCTLAGLEGGALGRHTFDLALVDEATQAIEPLALGAFLRAEAVVLAGDHQQLPPTVVSREAAREGLATSLFERLVARFDSRGSDGGERGRATAGAASGAVGAVPEEKDRFLKMLREQHRMSEALMAFPSAQLYGGALRAHPAVAERRLDEVLTEAGALDAPPTLFLDTAGKGMEEAVEQRDGGQATAAGPGAGGSLLNDGEASLIVPRVRALLEAGLPAGELAVISPYAAQARLLRERLEGTGVEVDTIDAFQGREKDAVLVTLVRSNPDGRVGFLEDLRRMNVAMTRARRHLFVVGDSATLGAHPFYRAFVEHTQREGGYRSAWDWAEAEG